MNPSDIAGRIRHIATQVDLLALAPTSMATELRQLADQVEQGTVDAAPWTAIGQAMVPLNKPPESL